MAIESHGNGGFTATGNHIELFRMKSQLGALALELRGLKRRGRSAYSIIKEVYGLKGSKQKVYDQFKQIVDDYAMAANAAEGAEVH